MSGIFIPTNGSSGTGDVVGPISAVDSNFAAFDTTTGKLIKDSTKNSASFAPALGVDDNYVTDAEKIVIGNTSGTNTGDNATNTQYSGLATSKEDTSNKKNTMTGNEASDVFFLSAKSIYTWATGLFATISNLALKAPIASPTFTGTVTTPAITITTGAGASKVLTSDAGGVATWQTPSGGGGGSQTEPLQDYQGTAIIGVLGSYVFDSSKTISKVTLTVDSIPVGSNCIVELRKNSYTTGNILPSTLQVATTDTLTNGKKSVSVTLSTSNTVVAGDYVVAYMTDVGSTTPSINAVVNVTFA